MPKRYFSVIAPAPWNTSGKAKITVRTGGACEVYVCVGNHRAAMSAEEAWALWVALGTALPATFGPAPEWATSQATPPGEDR
ncbi:hypothetical protein GCM10010517_30800 [Streptosporangium fragile]|uniref:Uncharacterized protein n=1 Tax=Streptosporangium fragile TaxID=46186 RepID=A0ABP6IG80_9ACTN